MASLYRRPNLVGLIPHILCLSARSDTSALPKNSAFLSETNFRRDIVALRLVDSTRRNVRGTKSHQLNLAWFLL
jgi:hypothetical protein